MSSPSCASHACTCHFVVCRCPVRSAWAMTAPFSPASPSLTLMNPQHNSFWSRAAVPPRTKPEPPSSLPREHEIFVTPDSSIVETNGPEAVPPPLRAQLSDSSDASDIFHTPETTLDSEDVFGSVELRKHANNMGTITENDDSPFVAGSLARSSLRENKLKNGAHEGVMRSKSDYEIPLKNKASQGFLHLNLGTLGLSPASRRRIHSTNEVVRQSTPNAKDGGLFKLPDSPIQSHSYPSEGAGGTRAISLNSLRHPAAEHAQQTVQQTRFVLYGNIYWRYITQCMCFVHLSSICLSLAWF